MQGWIKLHRKIVDWEWYDDLPTKSLFIHLLILANHEDNMWHGKRIEKGSLVTSVASLSAQTGMSVKQVRTALSHLEKTGEIGKQTTSHNTLIIVLNYGRYQDFDISENSEKGKQGASSGQTRGKQRATNKNDNNDKNVKNDKKKDIYCQVIEYLNEKANKKYSYKTESTQQHINARLNEGYTLDDFKKVIDNKCKDWLNTDMDKFLRPITLFNTKFESYLNQKANSKAPQSYCEY